MERGSEAPRNGLKRVWVSGSDCRVIEARLVPAAALRRLNSIGKPQYAYPVDRDHLGWLPGVASLLGRTNGRARLFFVCRRAAYIWCDGYSRWHVQPQGALRRHIKKVSRFHVASANHSHLTFLHRKKVDLQIYNGKLIVLRMQERLKRSLFIRYGEFR